MKEYGTHCPKCNREGCLAVAVDAVVTNPGPEGTLHVIGCTRCGWHRSSAHYKGINRYVQLRNIIKVQTKAPDAHLTAMEEGIRRFSHD